MNESKKINSEIIDINGELLYRYKRSCKTSKSKPKLCICSYKRRIYSFYKTWVQKNYKESTA